MKLAVTLDYRFDRTPDGGVWTKTTFPHEFWRRYLEVFDGVRVVARVKDAPSVTSDWQRVDGPGVEVFALPHYIGTAQYLKALPRLRRALFSAVEPRDAVILRVGSPIADLLQPRLRARAQPYGVEVVGDPWDVFSPGVFKHPLRPFLRRWFAHKLREHCRHAAAASYVTQAALQARYPVSSGRFSIAASSIELLPEHFAAGPRTFGQPMRRMRLLFIGTLEQLQKAPDVLIAAVASCVREGSDLELRLVGAGRCRPQLEALAKEQGVAERVVFMGQLAAGDPVRHELDRADLFVLPSRGEGLPRAMIEAMAKGLPCIGSEVSGIPELLPEQDRVRSGDVAGLAAKLREVLADPARMEQMSRRNLETARGYLADGLRRRRLEFYRELRRITEARDRRM